MIHLSDGLYTVVHEGITAGFVVRAGKVTMCAPILRNNIELWAKKAKLVPTNVELPPPQLAEA